MNKVSYGIAMLVRVFAKDHNREEVDAFAAELLSGDGGPGSGNHGHAGRPGERGGSAPKGSGGGGEKEIGEENIISGSAFTANPSKSSIKGNGGGNIKSGAGSRVKVENAVKADEKFKNETMRKKIESLPEGSEERKAWEHYASIASDVCMEMPSKEEIDELHKKMLSNISSQLKPYAAERYKKAVEAEPKITSDLMEISQEIGTGMYGIPFRLKSAGDSRKDGHCRIEDKIQENIKNAARKRNIISYEQATDKLSDLNRYTQACTPENLVENFQKTNEALLKRGYKQLKVKNTWETYSEENPYRGVNCVYATPDGQRFELQFQTAESLAVKEVQHPWYEEARSPKTKGTAREAELNKRMYENAKSMKMPKDIGKIAEYRAPGEDHALKKPIKTLGKIWTK